MSRKKVCGDFYLSWGGEYMGGTTDEKNERKIREKTTAP